MQDTPQDTSPKGSGKSPLLSRRGTLLAGAALLLGAGALGVTLLRPEDANANAVPSAAMAAGEAFAKARDGEITLVDIRTPPEWAETGVPEGAVALDMTQEESFIKALVALRKADPSKPIALICRTGNRSGQVVRILASQGFTGLVDVAEGVAGGRNGKGWLPGGLPTYAGTPAEIEARRARILP